MGRAEHPSTSHPLRPEVLTDPQGVPVTREQFDALIDQCITRVQRLTYAGLACRTRDQFAKHCAQAALWSSAMLALQELRAEL
jgi:hypothetical protein